MMLTLVRAQTTYKVRVVETRYSEAAVNGDSANVTYKRFHASTKMTIEAAQELTREEILARFGMSSFNEDPGEWSYRMDYFDTYKGWQSVRTITIP